MRNSEFYKISVHFNLKLLFVVLKQMMEHSPVADKTV